MADLSGFWPAGPPDTLQRGDESGLPVMRTGRSIFSGDREIRPVLRFRPQIRLAVETP
jgi:hypothetical protein